MMKYRSLCILLPACDVIVVNSIRYFREFTLCNLYPWLRARLQLQYRSQILEILQQTHKACGVGMHDLKQLLFHRKLLLSVVRSTGWWEILRCWCQKPHFGLISEPWCRFNRSSIVLTVSLASDLKQRPRAPRAQSDFEALGRKASKQMAVNGRLTPIAGTIALGFNNRRNNRCRHSSNLVDIEQEGLSRSSSSLPYPSSPRSRTWLRMTTKR